MDVDQADLEHAEPDGVVLAAVAIGTGVLLRRVLSKQWEKRTGRTPPTNPADADVAWSEALGWAALTGVAIGVGRVVARRVTTAAWRRASS